MEKIKAILVDVRTWMGATAVTLVAAITGILDAIIAVL